MKSTSESARTSAMIYEPVPCPGLPPEACEALNTWGAAWKDWADEMVGELDRIMTNVAPPPPPPPKWPIAPRPPFILGPGA